MTREQIENKDKIARIKRIKEKARKKMTALKKKKKNIFARLKDNAAGYLRRGGLYVMTFFISAGPASAAPRNSFGDDDKAKANAIEMTSGAVKEIAMKKSINYEETVSVNIDEMKREIINNHIAGTIEYSYNAYRSVLGNRTRVLSREYRDTYNTERGKYYYCLRSHTKAIENYRNDNGLTYLDDIFPDITVGRGRGKMNLAGCTQFIDQMRTTKYLDDFQCKTTTINSGRTVYSHPIKLEIDDIKVGDIIFLKSSRNSVSGLHAVKAIGHEYDAEGKITSAIMLSLNSESFIRFGTEGEFSTVIIPDYKKEKFNNVSSATGIIANMSDIMMKNLDEEIASNYTENMSEEEKRDVAVEILEKYEEGIEEGNHIAELYNMEGPELIAGLTHQESPERIVAAGTNISDDILRTASVKPDVELVRKKLNANTTASSSQVEVSQNVYHVDGRREEENSTSVQNEELNNRSTKDVRRTRYNTRT
ncbi:MAG: hypothetical protein LBR70_03390 [Lactobacillaceae bacterium]|jgi:hypothetical protein|nr:hypothetical protein [Lactobacillaceae bacterium]